MNYFTMSDWQTKKKYISLFLNVCKFLGLALILTVIARVL